MDIGPRRTRHPHQRGLARALVLQIGAHSGGNGGSVGVCDVSTKETAETIYRAYSALGGNGVGSQMIEDIRHAHIARTEE